MRIPYYYATFQCIVDKCTPNKMDSQHIPKGTVRSIVDTNSHPFIWMEIQDEFGRRWACLFWKEISQEEYEYYNNRN